MLEFPVEGSIAVCQVVEEDTMVVAQEAFEVVLMEVEVASILRAVEEEHILVVEELASSWQDQVDMLASLQVVEVQLEEVADMVSSQTFQVASKKCYNLIIYDIGQIFVYALQTSKQLLFRIQEFYKRFKILVTVRCISYVNER